MRDVNEILFISCMVQAQRRKTRIIAIIRRNTQTHIKSQEKPVGVGGVGEERVASERKEFRVLEDLVWPRWDEIVPWKWTNELIHIRPYNYKYTCISNALITLNSHIYKDVGLCYRNPEFDNIHVHVHLIKRLFVKELNFTRNTQINEWLTSTS